MALINCPKCNNLISDKVSRCPHCGCLFPKVTGKDFDGFEVDADIIQNMNNILISFSMQYARLFNSDKYISHKALEKFQNSFSSLWQVLQNDFIRTYIVNHARSFHVDVEAIETFVDQYGMLEKNANTHNERYIEKELNDHKLFFDNMFSLVDPNIHLDHEQRKAVVTDDDYCLLVAGAGAGKTTTMAAKVKYLVDKKGVDPSQIIVISYTNKAIGELKERINKALNIPAKVCTFHKFAYDIIRQNSDSAPEVFVYPYRIIENILEQEIFDDKDLLKNLVLFLGYYFDLEEDVFQFDSLNQFHQYRAAQTYETIKSGIGDYVAQVRRKREQREYTINGEYLRSIQEVQIANFLYLNGLEYEYEKTYPFGSPSPRKKYTPDFYIKQGEHVAWLEHYAISESGYSNRFTEVERRKYKNSIIDKRNLHQSNNTVLLETWSIYNDKRSLLDHLKETLEQAGFVMQPRNLEDVYKKIVDTAKDKYIYKFTNFMMSFINQYKTCGFDDHGFNQLRNVTDNPRSLMFLDIAEKVYSQYQLSLKKNNHIDFADMINDANLLLSELQCNHKTISYQYIIIDEFQDIARQRFNLTKRLSEVTNAKIVAVGDDWQSIYAFSGADITLFTKFLELMGSGTELQITHTYRNAQELIDIAGGFVQKNSEQIRKALVSPKHLDKPIVIRAFNDKFKPMVSLAETIESVIGEIIEEYGENSSILLQGRYNFDLDKLANTKRFTYRADNRSIVNSKKYPKAKLTFLTSHSAKGLGFDNVILIDLFEGKFGFPCQIEDDPIMKLVTYEDTSMPFAEERRLFYVALTRTKNKVYLVLPKNRPSRFVIELVKDFNLSCDADVNMDIVDPITNQCPICGYPLKHEFNKNYGLDLWLCTNEPEICDFMTNDRINKYDIYRCPKCAEKHVDGFMIVKKNPKNGDVFYGCTNYKDETIQCRNTVTLIKGVNKA